LCETDQSSLFSAEVKNSRIYTTTSPYVFMMCLVKDSFKLYLVLHDFAYRIIFDVRLLQMHICCSLIVRNKAWSQMMFPRIFLDVIFLIGIVGG
jgi:hypothetical protein